jgi:hypothetical protein
VAEQYIDRLFIDSFNSCVNHFPGISDFYVVTPDQALLREKIEKTEIRDRRGM